MTLTLPPTYKLACVLIPPVTCSAPVVVLVASVEFVIATVEKEPEPENTVAASVPVLGLYVRLLLVNGAVFAVTPPTLPNIG